MARYIRKKNSKHLYNWTPVLADNPEMVECDANGRPVVPEEVTASLPTATQVAPAPVIDLTPEPPIAESPDAIQITADELAQADKARLRQIAAALKLDIHPATKESTIREKIAALLFPED